MEDFIGYCVECSKEVYCKDGFLEGVIQENKSLVCFICYKRIEKEE